MSALDQALQALNTPAAVAAPGRCRVCGCTHDNACIIPGHGPCWWVTPDLCSFCADPAAVLYFLKELRKRGVLADVPKPIDLWMRRAESVLQMLHQSKLEALEL